MFGFLNLNKPIGISSRACINQVQRHLNKRAKLGHCGTLDPLASGVLVAAIGPATRLAQFVQHQPKIYRGTFQLGVTSATEDTEGEIEPLPNPPVISREQLEEALLKFTGEIEQMPPRFSALKVDGKRAYQLARKGKPVHLKPRRITIHRLELLSFDGTFFQLEIECGSGTYVRSLGRDLALHVGSAAIMTQLERTAIGEFKIAQSIDPAKLNRDNLENYLVDPLIGIGEMPRLQLGQADAAGLINGEPVRVSPAQAERIGNQLAAGVDNQDRLLALMRPLAEDVYSPKINFAKYYGGE